MHFNLICASHDAKILEINLAASKFYKIRQVRLMAGYTNVSEAYNNDHKECEQDEYNVYPHHDVFLPPDFEQNLKQAIQQINSFDSNWGVLGVAGARMDNGKRNFLGCVRDRGSHWGTFTDLPQQVQTLDELLLITKGDFIFDTQFDLHFYGADICMQAIAQGRKNYAIYTYVHHNSNLKLGWRTDSFRACEAKFKNKWQAFLPIATTCTIII